MQTLITGNTCFKIANFSEGIRAGPACRFLNIPFVPNVTGLGPAFNRDGLLNRTIRSLWLVPSC